MGKREKTFQGLNAINTGLGSAARTWPAMLGTSAVVSDEWGNGRVRMEKNQHDGGKNTSEGEETTT